VHARPQLPQLAAVVNWTQAPLQSVYPVSHEKLHLPPTHAGSAFATVVVQTSPQPLQLFGSLVRSTQLLLQLAGVEGGQLGTQP